MDIEKYDRLRRKQSTKDFEGKYGGLDWWLFRISFVGNIISIFFAYFFLYPSLLRGITVNITDSYWGEIIALIVTIVLLITFEVIKRYVVRNLSYDYVVSGGNIRFHLMGWFAIAICVVGLSFYLSLTGSKNLASVRTTQNQVVIGIANTERDSVIKRFDNLKNVYEVENTTLREVNDGLRDRLLNTPLNYRVVRNEYQTNIDKNVEIIRFNQEEIRRLNSEMVVQLDRLDKVTNTRLNEVETEDTKNIILFIIIVIFNEFLIILGIFFREWYEVKLYHENQKKFEKVYVRRDRYQTLLAFIYGNGKVNVGDKVIGVNELKRLVKENSPLVNSNRVVEDFIKDMDRVGILNMVGNRRVVSVSFKEAMEIINGMDNSFRMLEKLT